MSCSSPAISAKPPLVTAAISSVTTFSSNLSDDSILKPSTLGAAGLKSLVNRRIDGEDVVKMTRKMKGRLRDEFIGYVEILSKNGQMMCKCERRAAVTTNPDGMKEMVGTDCLTEAPCSFVIGRLKKNKIPENTTKPSNADTLTPLPSDPPLPNVPEAVSSTAAKPVTRKPKQASIASNRISRKATKPVSDQPRTQRSNGILTKTGLYVTITDSGLRVGPDNNVPNKPSKPRGRQGLLTTPPNVPTSGALEPEILDDSNPTDNIPVTELLPANVEPDEHAVLLQQNASPSNSEFFDRFELIQSTDPSLFDMSVAQFLSPSCSSSAVTINSDCQINLSDFFSNATGSTFLSMESSVFDGTGEDQSHPWELNTNPLFSDDTVCRKESESDFDSVFTDVFGEADSGFLDAITEQREPVVSTSAAISANTHPEQTNRMEDLFFQLQESTTHEPLQSSPWLPILPEKDFQQYRSVSPSSSLSSVSSFTTSGSILSNSNFGSSPAPSRKRQYPSISANNVFSYPHSSNHTIHSDSGSNRSTPELKKSTRGGTRPTPSPSTPQKSTATPSLIDMKASTVQKPLQQEGPEISLRQPPSSMAFYTRITPSISRTRRSLMTPTTVPNSGSSNHATTTPFVQSVVGSVAGARAAAAAAARASVSKLGTSRGSAPTTPSTTTASSTSVKSRNVISGAAGGKSPVPFCNGSATMSSGRQLSLDSGTAGKLSYASSGKSSRVISSVGPLSKAVGSATATMGTKTFNAAAFEEPSPASSQMNQKTSVGNSSAVTAADPLVAILNWTGQDTIAKSVSEENPPWFPGMIPTTAERGGADLFDMLFNGPMDMDVSSGHGVSGMAATEDYGNASSLMVQDDWLF
ncbi:hypothetical protein BJ741DRAFT_207461 [Chytriomyces cf. hyalinus JEL632]|nr:hypothetical protein BJ741DRAFT_207461 [Chytriomyces cf. hyalinus JEL632]